MVSGARRELAQLLAAGPVNSIPPLSSPASFSTILLSAALFFSVIPASPSAEAWPLLLRFPAISPRPERTRRVPRWARTQLAGFRTEAGCGWMHGSMDGCLGTGLPARTPILSPPLMPFCSARANCLCSVHCVPQTVLAKMHSSPASLTKCLFLACLSSEIGVCQF